MTSNYRIKGTTPYHIDFALFVNGNRYAIEIKDDQKRTNEKQLTVGRMENKTVLRTRYPQQSRSCDRRDQTIMLTIIYTEIFYQYLYTLSYIQLLY